MGIGRLGDYTIAAYQSSNMFSQLSCLLFRLISDTGTLVAGSNVIWMAAERTVATIWINTYEKKTSKLGKCLGVTAVSFDDVCRLVQALNSDLFSIRLDLCCRCPSFCMMQLTAFSKSISCCHGSPVRRQTSTRTPSLPSGWPEWRHTWRRLWYAETDNDFQVVRRTLPKYSCSTAHPNRKRETQGIRKYKSQQK